MKPDRAILRDLSFHLCALCGCFWLRCRNVKWLLAGTLAICLGAQETPPSNRVAWFSVFPEPLPQGVNQVTLEVTSQFLRPDYEQSGDGRTIARLDGEEWQLTGDLAFTLGPGRVNLRVRAVDRSGGIADQAILTWHQAFGMDGGDRGLVPKYRLAYHLERDGVVIGDLQRPGLHLLDTDIAYVVPFGDAEAGWRLGGSLQLPAGKREDFSGSGGLDGLVGAAAWKRYGHWRIHGQAERVFIGLPSDSSYRLVLAHRAFSRVWTGGGWQGDGSGILSGLGLDVTLAYAGSPYEIGIPRIDRSGWQQHWTFTHHNMPRWHFGISEEAGTYTAPDITACVSYAF